MRGKVDNCIIFDNSCQINVIFIRGNQDGQPVTKVISIGYKVHPSACHVNKTRRKYSINKIYDNGNKNLHADSKIITKENMWIKREGKKGA